MSRGGTAPDAIEWRWHVAQGALEPAAAHHLAALVDYGDGAVVSRVIGRGEGTNITLFAFDEGQELSEHSTPQDAYVVVLDGECRLTVGGAAVAAGPGDVVLMPASVPHAVLAATRFKMMLVMVRP
jgi:quercetin dioxygenase-like cupin family protein